MEKQLALDLQFKASCHSTSMSCEDKLKWLSEQMKHNYISVVDQRERLIELNKRKNKDERN